MTIEPPTEYIWSYVKFYTQENTTDIKQLVIGT